MASYWGANDDFINQGLYLIQQFSLAFVLAMSDISNKQRQSWYLYNQCAAIRKDYELNMSIRNFRRVAFMMQALAMVFELRLTKQYKTRRDLFYEQKRFFGDQRKFDHTIRAMHRFFGKNISAGHVLASGRGLVVGPLKILKSEALVDCSMKVVVIDDFSHCLFHTSAQFVLVVEKDATFRKLISEGFFTLFPDGILVTGRGYPDMATRILLSKLNRLPLFGLMDCDPYGIEIAMTYKYGSIRKNFGTENRRLPHFEWVGLSRSILSANDVPDRHYLPLQEREKAKIGRLSERAAASDERALLIELQLMREYGNKLELEAVSGMAPGAMCKYLLKTKVSEYSVCGSAFRRSPEWR